MSKIKICGITQAEEVVIMNEVHPDYIGFVFASSRRQVTKEQAKALRALLSPLISVVGVFVNEKIERIQALVREGIIDLVQLHGDEDDVYLEELNKTLHSPSHEDVQIDTTNSSQVSCTQDSQVPYTKEKRVPIIKAIRVGDIWEAPTRGSSDYYLFDKKSKVAYGGLGERFDWDLIKAVDKPYFLAGGIAIDNIDQALHYQPYCIDISSGVETNGLKNKEKIHAIVGKVRGYCG